MNSPRKPRLLSCCLALFVTGTGALPALCAQNSATTSIIQKGFEGFKRGMFGDAGANTYLSAKGNLQTVHRSDLNHDGEIDLLFVQDHNLDFAPDSMIYWGGANGPDSLLPEMSAYRPPYTLLKHAENAQKSITWLPSLGGGRCVIADLNKDGYPDLVFGNTMHNYRQDMPAYIYWGSAQGYRESDRTILPGYTVTGVAVGDLNEDGLPDIVLSNLGFEKGWDVRFGPMTHHLESYIYWNDANGFDSSRRTSLPTVSAEDAAIGDFNGDKHLDVALVNSSVKEPSVYLYWGDGTGKFSEASRQRVSIADTKPAEGEKAIEMTTLLASDLNGDGLTDLIVAGNRKAIIFSGTKTGLSADRTAELPADNCGGMEAMDLNRDGYVDLVLANTGAEGRRKNPPASVIYWGDKQGYKADRNTPLPTLGAKTVKAGDLNKDGSLDLLFGNFSSDGKNVPTQIFWGSADGFAPYRRKELEAFGVVGAGLADLNGDGNLDVFLMNHLSGGEKLPAVIYWGNKEHYYSSGSVTILETALGGMQTVADLDDDGFPDLVMAPDSQTPVIWWGSASGYDSKNRTEVPTKAIGGKRIHGMAVADLDHDGYLDLVFSGRKMVDEKDQGSAVFVVYGNGQRFTGNRITTLPLDGAANYAGAPTLTIADLNKDGHPDLICPLMDTGVALIYWGSPKGYEAGNVTKYETNGAAHAAVADLDNDGWLDVIFSTSGMGRMKEGQVVVGGSGVIGKTRNSESLIFWGGPEGLKTKTAIPAYQSQDTTVADFNRDGHLDIAISNYISDTTRELPAIIYFGDGTRTGFKIQHRQFLDAASSLAIDALDLNRDGWPELLVTNHQKNFSHSSGTNIYWGGEKGYSVSNRTNIPTIGVHYDTGVDSGNIYTRKYEWDYVSAPIEAAKDMGFTALKWKAATELGTGIKFQVRSATTQAGLAKAGWTGPDGATSYYTASGSQLAGVGAKDVWLQYRAVLTSPDAANSAVLSEVEIVCSRR